MVKILDLIVRETVGATLKETLNKPFGETALYSGLPDNEIDTLTAHCPSSFGFVYRENGLDTVVLISQGHNLTFQSPLQPGTYTQEQLNQALPHALMTIQLRSAASIVITADKAVADTITETFKQIGYQVNRYQPRQ